MKYRLGEVVINFDRQRIPLSASERAKRKGVFRYYGAQGVIDHIDDFIFDGEYMLVAEDGENVKSQKHNIAQIVSGQFWVNNHAHILQSNELSDLRYLCYALNIIDISGYVTGSAQPKLTQANLNAIEIDLPDLPTQRAIAKTLSALDDKIANNTKINHHLEQMAQAIFKSWFEDFEPWGGVMPDDWREAELGEVISIKHGYAFKGEYFCDEPTDFLLVTPGNFAIGGGFQEKPKFYNGPIPKDYVLRQHDLIVTMTDLSKQGDTLGYSALVPESNKYLHNQRIGLVSQVVDLPLKDFIYWLMRTHEYQRFIVNHASGSTVKHTSPKTILSYRFSLPDENGLNIIVPQLHAINEKISHNNTENARLATLRDALLPRLMSGELSVANVDAK